MKTKNTKPELCYVMVPGAAPGKRIGIIKRGERGYYAADADSVTASAEIVREVVDDLNARLGVDKIEARAMLCGSMFGWDVPAANSDHTRQAFAEAEAIADARQSIRA